MKTSPGDSDSPFPAGLVSTGALHGWFAASAYCAWLQSWRQASIAGDANATAQAAQTIAQAPGWKAVADEDPQPDPSAANDPGAEPGTLFGWMLPYRDAVLAGDRARLEHLLATGYGGGRCWLSDPLWMAQVRAHADDWARLSQKELAQKYRQFLADGRSRGAWTRTRVRASSSSSARPARTCSRTSCAAPRAPRTPPTCWPRPT